MPNNTIDHEPHPRVSISIHDIIGFYNDICNIDHQRYSPDKQTIIANLEAVVLAFSQSLATTSITN
jgi:hypothetical protein